MILVRRPVMLLAPAALLVVALALATNVLPLRQIVAQRQEIAATQATLDALVDQNSVLEAKVEALDTPIEVERIAREELGYIRPGETAFVAMDPTPAESGESATVAAAEKTSDASTATVSAASSDRGFFARVWDYVTGRDLANGG